MKKTNKLISILIAVAMLLSMAPLSLTASAASEAIELRDYYTTKVDYSNSATQYYQYNNYLYKVAYSNLKNISEVAISHDSYDYLKLNFTESDTGDTGWVAYLTTSYQGNTAKLSNLPTSSGKSVSFYTSNTVASNAKNPVITVTCMSVNEPVWSWSGSSATAAFTSTDGKATMTVTAAIESSEQTAVTCLENDKTTYTATATANGKAYTNEKTVDGEQGPHSFEYSGDDVIGSCTNGCGYECDHAGQASEICGVCGKILHTHSFTYSASGDTITAACENTDGNCPDSEGTLTILAPADLYVDGTAKEATVENNLVDTSVAVSDITYSTADGSAPTTAGTYTASITVGGATATVEFTLLNYAATVTDKDGNAVGTYKTFAEAVTAAEGSEGSTLTLLDDVTLTAEQNIRSGKFTLDLNGKNLINVTGRVLYIYEEADLTIKDSGEGGTVQTNGETAQAIYSYGTLTVESGNIKGAGGIDNKGTLTFKDGTVETVTYSAIYNTGTAYVYDGVLKHAKSSAIGNYGTLYVYDGEIDGVSNDGTAYISGGEIDRDNYAALNLLGGKLEITGGSFTGTDFASGYYSGTPYGEWTVYYNEGAILTLKGGEFPNGFVVAKTTANTFLAEDYYYKDADGKLIDVADDAKIINGYVKVSKGADLADAVITLDETQFTYSGMEHKPTVIVTISGKALTEGKDYTLTFANNVNAGTATVTVTAVADSDYSGEATAQFTINKKPVTVTATAPDKVYDGTTDILEYSKVTVKFDGAVEGEMIGFTVGKAWYDTSDAGTDKTVHIIYAPVASNSIDNYEFPVNPECSTDNCYVVAKADITKKAVTVSATVPDRIYGDDYRVDTSKVVITFDGIVEGDDVGYVVTDAWYHAHTVTNNAPVPVVYNVNGADADNYQFPEYGDWIAPNYGVEATGRVLPRDIANAEITLGDALVYNGAEQTQTVAAVTVDGLEVTYTVSGNKATDVGVYELTITANTNFTGTKTVLYTINPDLSGIEGLDQYNVKSTNKADIEYVYNQLDNAVTDLASAEKEAEWKEIKDECWQWLKILESVEYRVESLGNSHLAYDIDTVTSADDEALLSLEAEMYLFMRDYRDNMTEEELLKVDNARIEISNLRDRIAETKSEYDRVIAVANGYDESTVTSADKDALIQLDADIFALALTQNVTQDEKTSLMNAHTNVFACIQKITYVSEEIKRIVAELEKYVFGSVKSSDKADIQQLIADIKALLDTQNITADERALLEGADETCDKLIAKIDETVAEINRINDATTAYDEATVTSADKADIEKLLVDIKALTDGDNITADERKQLEGNEATLKALLDKIGATAEEIERIETAVNSYDEATVKSTDKADLEQLKADIKVLTDATNITEDERTELGELDAKLDALIKKIDDTAKEIERIENAVNGYDEETVKSSDIPALGKLIDDIKALTDGDNLTEDEKAALEETDKAIDELVEKLAEVAEEIKRVDEAVKSYDEETVKSTDSEDLAQLKEDIQSLIDSGNVTENEKTALGEMIEKVDALEEKIEEIETQLEEIKDIENNFNPENVSSDDKAAIEDKIAEIEAVNPDNLTDEQKAEYDEIKAGFEALLEEIAAAEKDVADIGIELEMFDENRVTKFWEDDIEALKAKIDELLADENMGEAEKAKLNEYKAQAEKLIEIINTPKEYFSLRFFYLIWDCLTWKYNGILWLFSKIFGC